jgi:hypothetical protein
VVQAAVQAELLLILHLIKPPPQERPGRVMPVVQVKVAFGLLLVVVVRVLLEEMDAQREPVPVALERPQ